MLNSMQEVINEGMYDGKLFFMDEQRNSMYLSLILYKETLEECNEREYKELGEEIREVLPMASFTGEETRIRSEALLELQGWLVRTKKAKIMDYTSVKDAARLPELKMVEWWVSNRKAAGLSFEVGAPRGKKQVFDELDLEKLTDDEWNNVMIFSAESQAHEDYREVVYFYERIMQEVEYLCGENVRGVVNIPQDD